LKTLTVSIPTAAEIATAITVACRETGEDPVQVAMRVHKLRARHYALHALAYVFPKCPKSKLCDFVGCNGRPDKFWDNSRSQVVDFSTGRARVRVAWWNGEVYERVVRAIEADRTKRAVASKPLPAPPATKPEIDPYLTTGRFAGAGDPPANRKPANASAAPPPPKPAQTRGPQPAPILAKPGRLLAQTASMPSPPVRFVSAETPAGPTREKLALQDMLREAALNTAKLQQKP
jgi:hypothetical protein